MSHTSHVCVPVRHGQGSEHAHAHAHAPGAARSEEIVGKWLTTQRRDDFVLATKLRFPSGTGLNNSGNSRKHVRPRKPEKPQSI